MPPVTSAMHVYHLLSQSGTSLHMPVGLELQLLDVKDMETEDNDVGRSMYQLLQVSLPSQWVLLVHQLLVSMHM